MIALSSMMQFAPTTMGPAIAKIVALGCTMDPKESALGGCSKNTIMGSISYQNQWWYRLSVRHPDTLSPSNVSWTCHVCQNRNISFWGATRHSRDLHRCHVLVSWAKLTSIWLRVVSRSIDKPALCNSCNVFIRPVSAVRDESNTYCGAEQVAGVNIYVS